MSQFTKHANFLFVCLIIGIAPALCIGQDRDITEGSSTGSIRSDVSERPSGPRRRMLTPESRAALVAEFDMFRGAEALLNAPSFDALKDSYREALEKVANEKPIATNLTPLKYLVFELMARAFSQKKPGLNPDGLAESMISIYVKTRDFLPPILAAGFSREEAKAEERNAVLVLHRLTRQRIRPPATAVTAAPGGPQVGAVTITYGVVINDRPRKATAGVPKRKGTLGLNVRVAPRFVLGATFDTFSAKKRSDGTYITGIGNTTASVKYEAIDEMPKHPSLNLTYTITLPSASVAKTLGTGRVDHKIMGDLGKKVQDTKLGLSLGVLFAGRKGKPGYTKTGLGAISLDHPLGARFTSKNEIDFATRADTNPSEIFALNQIVYKISDSYSVRIGVRTGITAQSPRIGLTVGLTITTSLKKIFGSAP